MHEDDPAHLATLEDLRRRAVEIYGEDRAANTMLDAVLRAAATAVWRVLEEPLEPSDAEP